MSTTYFFSNKSSPYVKEFQKLAATICIKFVYSTIEVTIVITAHIVTITSHAVYSPSKILIHLSFIIDIVQHIFRNLPLKVVHALPFRRKRYIIHIVQCIIVLLTIQIKYVTRPIVVE